MTKSEMIDNLVQILGEDHFWVYQFKKACKKYERIDYIETMYHNMLIGTKRNIENNIIKKKKEIETLEKTLDKIKKL